MRKILAMLLTLALVLSFAVPVFAEGEKSDDIVILYTNDVHTYIDGDLSYDVLAAIKAQYQSLYNNVILVDAGDHSQGTAYGSMDKGKTIIELMNAAGYDLATLGNHEFDYGMDGCINIRDWANFPYVSCNFYNEANGVRGTNVLDSYKLFTFGDEVVAIIGMTTPESFTKSTPAYFQDAQGNYIYGIAGGEDGAALYADVQKAIDEAKAAGATVIIGLGHLGDDPASQPWTSEETIANVSGLDAFIDGHSHSTVKGKEVTAKDGSTTLLTQTGEYFNRIGVMIIDAETGAITTDFIETTDVTPDAEVKALKDAWIAEIDTQLGQKIGSTELVLDNYDENGKRIVRKQETNTGDFAADALYYLFDNMDMDVDVAIMNGGGVRNKAVTGDISYKTCKDIHTFGNVACLQTITGQQLLDALEWGARGAGTGEEIGGFLHVSGITYKIDTSIASTVQIDDKGVWAGAPTDKYRVHSVMVYNKETNAYEPLDLAAKYNLAGYNYTLRDLGDGFAMFSGAVNVLDYVMEDYMVLANYVKGYEDGIVGAKNSPLLAKYANLKLDYATVNGSGRIVMEGKPNDIVILYTNDVHTYIDGDLSYDVLAAIKAQYQSLYNNVILVDAGDHSQGTAYGSMDKGKTIIELMNAAGYDLATLGNHEFDYGMDGCINIRDWANFPYVSCNFYNEANGVRGTNVLDSYKLFTFGDEVVALIGMTTPETFTKSTPAYFQDAQGNYIYGIAGGEDGAALYADVQKAIDEAKAAGATVIIGLGHLGDDPASQPWTSEETIANVSGLDAFIDGHSHSTVLSEKVADKDGNEVILTQTGEYFKRIGVMIIDGETGAITTDFIEATDVTPDAEVKALKDAWIAEIDTQLGQKIGSTELVLDNYDENGKRIVRKQETNTGDFAADALYYLFDNMDMDVDVAIMNGGGVRNKAVTGEITYKVCKNIHTFGNVACLQTITGQQLLDALEWGARGAGTGEEIGGFLHVSGITYKIDTSIASTVQIDDKGVWAGAPTDKYRVHSVMVYNKETNAYEPLDLSAKYNLAGYNYTLRDLGDGFAMFSGAVNVLDYVMEDYMVLANYVKGYEDGIVGAKNSPLLAKYANLKLDYATVNGSGRIVMEAKETAPELDPTELIAVLEGLKELNPEDYTEESVLAVEAALADVFELIEKEDLTQEELDAAVEALKAAIDALEPIQSETEPTEPETEPTEPETEPTEPEATTPTTKPGTGDNAQTGDFSIVIYCMLALSSICSMGLVIGKKKH